MPDAPKGAALADLVEEYYDMMLEFYGPDLGLRGARKHLGWYMEAAGCDPERRHPILTSRDPAEVRRLMRQALTEAPGPELSRAEAA